MKHISLGLLLLVIGTFSQAHHARFGFFSNEESVEVSGVVTSLSWANPHVRLQLDVTNAEGVTEHWHAELAALSSFRNRGISEPFVKVGEKITLYGNPSRTGVSELSPTNLLRESGTEVILSFGSAPYFESRRTDQFVDPVASEESQRQAIEAADGIYRVWSTTPSTRAFPTYYGSFPLTEIAAEEKAKWNPVAEDLLSCWQKGMPLLMVTPHPIQFLRRGGDIVLRFEEDDAERVIHMENPVENAQSSPLGYSTGRWEGNVLVVETSRISASIFDDIGTPQSEQVHLVEWFELSEDEHRLDYQIRITDPATFRQPIELHRHWVWIPERSIQKWNCVD